MKQKGRGSTTISVRADFAEKLRNVCNRLVIPQIALVRKVFDVPGPILILRMKEGRQEFVKNIRDKGVVGRHNVYVDDEIYANLKVVAKRVGYKTTTFANLILSVSEDRLVDYLESEEVYEPESKYI